MVVCLVPKTPFESNHHGLAIIRQFKDRRTQIGIDVVGTVYENAATGLIHTLGAPVGRLGKFRINEPVENFGIRLLNRTFGELLEVFRENHRHIVDFRFRLRAFWRVHTFNMLRHLDRNGLRRHHLLRHGW